jgi:hypothetical protein
MTESVIERFLKEAGGNWIRADDCVAGDQLKIATAPVIDDETFENPYLVCGVTLMRTGENYKLRMGARNVIRISETLGKDEKQWVGRMLEVVSIEAYPGLGTKGLLLRGLPREPVQVQIQPAPTPQTKPQTGLSSETIEVLRKNRDLIEMGLGLNAADWNQIPAKVRVELIKQGLVKQEADLYTFTEEAKKTIEK